MASDKETERNENTKMGKDEVVEVTEETPEILEIAEILEVPEMSERPEMLETPKTPEIEEYSDPDQSLEAVDRFVRWLFEKEVCDLTTLYLRDEMDPDEFDLISNYGLDYIYPMYGPLVFDDVRKNLDQADPEQYVAEVSTQNGKEHENVKDDQGTKTKNSEHNEGFVSRERVKARVRFVLKDKEGCALAAWYLNWRNTQDFTKNRKEELQRFRNQIFSAVEKIRGISKKRQDVYNLELRTRRWIDYNVFKDEYEDVNELMFGAIYSFFENYKPTDLRIKVGTFHDDSLTYEEKIYKRPYGLDYPKILKSSKENSDIMWVVKTTRPMFGSKPARNKNEAHRIIVPIRLYSNIEECVGVVLVESNHKPFVPEMVKPLCFLADHFSRILV